MNTKAFITFGLLTPHLQHLQLCLADRCCADSVVDGCGSCDASGICSECDTLHKWAPDGYDDFALRFGVVLTHIASLTSANPACRSDALLATSLGWLFASTVRYCRDLCHTCVKSTPYWYVCGCGCGQRHRDFKGGWVILRYSILKIGSYDIAWSTSPCEYFVLIGVLSAVVSQKKLGHVH